MILRPPFLHNEISYIGKWYIHIEAGPSIRRSLYTNILISVVDIPIQEE